MKQMQQEQSVTQVAGPHRALTQADIYQRVFDLYDEYCHGRIDRREFLSRASAITVAGISGLAMAQALLPQYARADHLLHRLAHQGAVRELSLARRQPRPDARLPGAARR